jgi:chaperonin GroEL (HSP60 family)
VTSGANPVSIKKGIDKTVAGLIEELEKLARPVKGGDDIKGIVIVFFFDIKGIVIVVTIRTFVFCFLGC